MKQYPQKKNTNSNEVCVWEKWEL